MSNELVTRAAPAALTLGAAEAAAVQEAFAINVSTGSVSKFDLPRIKIMSGAALWLVPGLEREETMPRIEGVVVLANDTRVYYKLKNAGKVPPDCSSADAITGLARPGINLGGDCSKCPMSAFGTAIDGDGQGCKQVKQLFMVRGESMFPEVVSLPPTSIKAARQFFLKLATQGIPYFSALLAIELEKAEAHGQVYGKATMKFLRKLTPEETARAVEFHEMCKQFAGRVEPTGPEAGE